MSVCMLMCIYFVPLALLADDRGAIHSEYSANSVLVLSLHKYPSCAAPAF
jgi:hypothetical protein